MAKIQRRPNINNAPKVETSKVPLVEDIDMLKLLKLKRVQLVYPLILQETSGRASWIFPPMHRRDPLRSTTIFPATVPNSIGEQ
jgi:hypothetical protein